MILVTGASGFIGKHLIKDLIEIYGFDKVVALTSKPIEGSKYLLHNHFSFDENYFEKNGLGSIQTIIHLGAFTPKNAQQSSNRIDCIGNINSTSVLVNSKFPALRKFIFASTIDVYGNSNLINEASQISPISLYAISKLFCETMLENWAITSGVTYQTLRIGHIYGEGEEAYSKVIPNTMNRIIEGKAVQLWGSGEDYRSFLYVKDAVKAICNALNLSENLGPINLVGEHGIKIKDLIERIISITQSKTKVEVVSMKVQARNVLFDNSKMKKYLLDVETNLDVGLLNEWKFMKQLIQ